MDRTGLLKRRFEKRQVIDLCCKIITPMFLGDATQDAALRPEPFKGLLRYWWRVAAGTHYRRPEDLLKAENRIFGGAGGTNEWGKSLFSVEVEGKPKLGETLSDTSPVYHPEVGRSISPLLYLGYGPIIWKGGSIKCSRRYLTPNEKFKIRLSFPTDFGGDPAGNNADEGELIKRALFYFIAFGAIGSRSRNGWGSFQVENFSSIKNMVSPQKISLLGFSDRIFSTDYPHCLGGHNKNLTIWKTKNGYPTWEEAMKEMAQIYIDLRTKFPVDGRDDIDERHLLGFPITNHPAQEAPNWGRQSRHASPLRIFFRIRGGKCYGFMLHLPFGISKRMRENASKKIFFTESRQRQIWEKVYEILDNNGNLKRASINECV